MTNTPKRSAIKNPGLQDDHDPSDVGQRTANERHGIMQDERGQEQPTDKGRAQQKQQSQMEGPAAYARREEREKPPTPKYSGM